MKTVRRPVPAANLPRRLGGAGMFFRKPRDAYREIVHGFLHPLLTSCDLQPVAKWHDRLYIASSIFKGRFRPGATMETAQRSGCPINLTMEALGDKWSLIVIRDMMFGNRRHFRELMAGSMEGIASNILAARLKRLTELGFISAASDPTHKQKVVYSLTEKAIQLVPMLAVIGAWGLRHTPASEELSIRAELLEQGGQKLWDEFMEELRVLHLGKKPKGSGPSVLQRLTKAYEDVRDRKRKRG
jgi:DNA-binding HxlR family transcriptional regulator